MPKHEKCQNMRHRQRFIESKQYYYGHPNKQTRKKEKRNHSEQDTSTLEVPAENVCTSTSS